MGEKTSGKGGVSGRSTKQKKKQWGGKRFLIILVGRAPKVNDQIAEIHSSRKPSGKGERWEVLLGK